MDVVDAIMPTQICTTSAPPYGSDKSIFSQWSESFLEIASIIVDRINLRHKPGLRRRACGPRRGADAKHCRRPKLRRPRPYQASRDCALILVKIGLGDLGLHPDLCLETGQE